MKILLREQLFIIFFFLAAYSFITLESNTKLNHLKLKVNVNGLTRIHMSFFFFLFFVVFLNKVGFFFHFEFLNSTVFVLFVVAQIYTVLR